LSTESACSDVIKMTANVQGSNILDVLKKKMRATKEECEKYKEDCEDLQRKLQVEIMRREEVSGLRNQFN
jgi:tropomyosin-1